MTPKDRFDDQLGMATAVMILATVPIRFAVEDPWWWRVAQFVASIVAAWVVAGALMTRREIKR